MTALESEPCLEEFKAQVRSVHCALLGENYNSDQPSVPASSLSSDIVKVCLTHTPKLCQLQSWQWVNQNAFIRHLWPDMGGGTRWLRIYLYMSEKMNIKPVRADGAPLTRLAAFCLSDPRCSYLRFHIAFCVIAASKLPSQPTSRHFVFPSTTSAHSWIQQILIEPLRCPGCCYSTPLGHIREQASLPACS